MNRKGDMPTVLLVVVAVVLVITTLFTFLSFNGNFDGKSREFSEIMSKSDFNYGFIISSAKIISKETIECGINPDGNYIITEDICKIQDIKERFAKIAEKRDFKIEGTGNFFAKISSNDFEFAEKDGRYVLRAEELFVNSHSGGEKTRNELKRNFDICMEFNPEGDFTGNC